MYPSCKLGNFQTAAELPTPVLPVSVFMLLYTRLLCTGAAASVSTRTNLIHKVSYLLAPRVV